MEAKQLELLRQAGPARRAALALRLSQSAIRSSRRAIARRHPELDERGVLLRWAELHYGHDLADRVRRYLAARRGPLTSARRSRRARATRSDDARPST
jgi:hypothetical protein